MRGIAVARLHQMMVVARREEDDLLALRRLDNSTDIGGDLCPPRQDSDVHRLQTGEQRVVSLDCHRGLPGCHLITVIERVHPQLREILRTQLDDGDRLVHAADDGVLFLEDLHQHLGMPLIGVEHIDRAIEIDIAVIALADPFHVEPEDGGIEPFPAPHRRLGYRACSHRPDVKRWRRSAGTAGSAPPAADRRPPPRAWPGGASATRFSAMAQALPRSSAPAPGNAPDVSTKAMTGNWNRSACRISRRAFR